ncbi:DNA-directed RNA polymerase III subunit RPC7-like [Bulinus truncatus]|nr:DNA-directed RNA polymerase III subunit RPC7-like [Bulinus truncatus]
MCYTCNIEKSRVEDVENMVFIAQPPPLYPPLLFKPVPLMKNDDNSYFLNLKQELRESFHKSPYYIKEPNKVKDIVRYSDKYQLGSNDSVGNWVPDWSRFPIELKDKVKRKKVVRSIQPSIKKAKMTKVDDVSKLLEKLEETDVKTDNLDDAEGQEGVEEDRKKEQEDGEEDEEEVEDEEIEEETDYNLDYFDNGEGYGDDDEDDDEGPTY